MLRVLIACEFSGIVRQAFTARHCDAWSCDLLETEHTGQHYQCDVSDILYQQWDIIIAHPPCTYLASSGARWWASRRQEQQRALAFVRMLLDAPCMHIALENPIGAISTHICKPSQIIHPWQFGHGEKKSTCLWLKNLPPLQPTHIVSGRLPRIHLVPPSLDRWKIRSRTYHGIADAMASQWVPFVTAKLSAHI